MADPTTANQLLAVPTRGSDPGTWDLPVNSNTTALDGLFGGTQGISVSNASFSLTAPAGIVAASAGPTQAQNAILKFTGTVTANIQVTLPLPGYYIVDNQSTYSSPSSVMGFRAVNSGAVVYIDQGATQHIYNDGTNVRFVNMGRIGEISIWAGYNAMPAWTLLCTNQPYLLCDGTVYNISTFPVIGNRFGSAYGGNGITTFAVPDLRGRVPIPYDGTGARITVAGCGINGQTIGASQDKQTNALITGNLPPYTPEGTVASQVNYGGGLQNGFAIVTPGVNVGVGGAATGGTTLALNGNLLIGSAFTGTAQGGTSTPVNNVQPAQVTGIAVVRAA